MTTQSRQGLRIATIAAAAMTITACSQGDGVSIGTGQDPDPVVVDFPIAYIRAPLPVDDDGEFEQDDLREQITFDYGADLFYRDRASAASEEINITGELTQGMAAIRDVEIAYDGSALVFSMRYPFDPNADEEDLPTWNIWKYTFETGVLERVIKSDLTAEIGHDIMPKYLPDGRLIFASTRQTRSQAILLDEGKPGFPAMDEDQNEYSFNIHLMNDDGSGVEQVTYNQSHDLDPAPLSNGQIVFSRWDNAGPHNEINLYRANPDGSGLELLYGSESHATGTNGEVIHFSQPRELEDGRIMALVRPFTDTEGGGELIAIDTAQYVENTQPTAPNIGILSGPAQEDATVLDISTEPGVPSPGGRFASVYPILDGTERLLVSWSQCRLLEQLEDDLDPMTDDTRVVPCTDDRLANVFEQPDPDNPVPPPVGSYLVAPPLYGVWMINPREGTQLPIVPGQEGYVITEVVAADPKIAPPAIPDGINAFSLDPGIAESNEGIINIRNVYDYDGGAIVDIYAMADPLQTPAANRPARFLRVEKAVSIPDEDIIELDNTAFGVTTAFGMKEIVGYAPIEPDGSVMMKVPANTALQVSITDADGKRVSERHQNWISVRPGEELKCQGCHVGNSGLSHGRRDAFESAYEGAQAGWFEFPNTDPQWFIGTPGETMAEIRARITCANAGGVCDSTTSVEPSMNLFYTDVWAADPTVQANNGHIDVRYTNADISNPGVPVSPTTISCEQDWQAQCRSVINYESVIHPMWSVSRPQFDDMGQPVLDANGVQVDRQCTLCHTQYDPADGVTVMVPAGQLELTDGLSPDEPDHFHAYRELLVTDNLQEVVDGALVDVLVENGVDIDGNPIFETVPTPPPASTAGARQSGDFFGRFEDPNNVEHYGALSSAERRLIAEWLDVGAQYYNNPFDVPQ
jgi:hypothetical protein